MLRIIPSDLQEVPGHKMVAPNHSYYLTCTCGTVIPGNAKKDGTANTAAQRYWSAHLEFVSTSKDTWIDVGVVTGKTRGITTYSVVPVNYPNLREFVPAGSRWAGWLDNANQYASYYGRWVVLTSTQYKNSERLGIAALGYSKRDAIDNALKLIYRQESKGHSIELLVESDGDPTFRSITFTQTSLVDSVGQTITQIDAILADFSFGQIPKAQATLRDVDTVLSQMKLLQMKRHQLKGEINGAVERAVRTEVS